MREFDDVKYPVEYVCGAESGLPAKDRLDEVGDRTNTIAHYLV